MARPKHKESRKRKKADAGPGAPADGDAAGDTQQPSAGVMRKIFVENVEPLLVAVVLALVIRGFVVEAFQIPTGSMAPTLYGKHRTVTCENCGAKLTTGWGPNTGTDARCWNCGDMRKYPWSWIERSPFGRFVVGGDRILVNKNNYHFDAPERYSVIVFKHKSKTQPQKNYIKRLIGMSEERIAINHGDVYVNGTLAPKPERRQRSIWIPVYSMAWSGHATDLRHAWDCSPGKSFKRSQELWRLTGSGRAGYGPVFSDYAYDSSMPGIAFRTGNDVVGDLRLRFHVAAKGKGKLVATILEDALRHSLELVFDDKGDLVEATLVPAKGERTSLPAVPAQPDGHDVALWNCDGVLAVYVDGDRIADVNVADAEIDGAPPYGGAELAFEGDFDIRELRIDRDVYYRPDFDMMDAEPDERGRVGITVPEGYIFVMGDNVPISQDSRKHQMGFVKADSVIGQAFVVWWPVWRWRLTR